MLSETPSIAAIALPSPLLVADHAALDFLNSIARPAQEFIEWLPDGRGLINWLVAAGLLSKAEAAACSRTLPASELDRAAARARELRDWLRAFVKTRAGQPMKGLSEDVLRPLNAVLAQDASVRAVGVDNGLPREQTLRRWTGSDQLLQPIAHAIVDLICHADFTLIRNCESAACPMYFLDRTKSHRRRWCTMSLCGNRAKATAHRARTRG